MDKRSFFSPKLGIWGLLDILLLMGLAGTWLGLVGHWHWGLDLFSHFRWQYLGVCLLGSGWCVVMRRPRGGLAVCIASLLVNGAELYGTRGDPAFAVAEGKTLRVISLNVLTGNPHKEAVLEYLRSRNADVIFLMEVDATWALAMEGLKQSHPHHLMRSQQDNFGTALFSRVPLLSVEVFQGSEKMMPSVKARLVLEGRELVFLGTHPLPPVGGRMASSRDSQLTHLSQLVAEESVPVLLVGDLNSTPWSHGMRLLQKGNGLAFRSPAASSLPTWQAGNLFALPIDHALCTPPLVIPGRRIGPDVGSDHRPQELEVGWQR